MIVRSRTERVVDLAIIVFMVFVALIIFLPFWILLVNSVTPISAVRGFDLLSRLVPRQITLKTYQQLFKQEIIPVGYINTVIRTVVGTSLHVVFTVTSAYVLSKRQLPMVRGVTRLILFTLFFNGGLIPTYLLVKGLGLLNTRWALILPPLLGAYTLMIVRNFMFSIPESLEDSAYIDGANELTILIKIIMPLSLPIIATISLWGAVMHWNAWFDAMIYTTDPRLTVLQLVLRRVLLEAQTLVDVAASDDLVGTVTEEGVKAAIIFIAIGPIIIVYPFAQRYFIKGLMVGSVKG